METFAMLVTESIREDRGRPKSEPNWHELASLPGTFEDLCDEIRRSYPMPEFSVPAPMVFIEPRSDACPDCDGKGRYTDTSQMGWPTVKCLLCDGKGIV